MMKRLAISCFGLALVVSPAGLVFGQEREESKDRPRETSARDEGRGGDRPRDGQPREGQTRDGQTREGQSREGQSREGQSREGQTRGSDRPEGGFGRGDGGFGRGEQRGPGMLGGPGMGPGMMMARLPLMITLDANQDGEISAEEIDLAVVSLKKLDKNKDGKLTMNELAPNFEGMGGPGGPMGFGGGPGGPGGFGGNPEEMVNRMMESDKDNDGYISESELPERMAVMLERADTNGDKKISREEIIAMVKSRAAAGGRGPGFGGPGREGAGREGAGREGAGREGAAEREGGSKRPDRPTSE